jgi:hypothetical protein
LSVSVNLCPSLFFLLSSNHHLTGFSGTCGYSVAEQVSLFESIRPLFSGKASCMSWQHFTFLFLENCFVIIAFVAFLTSTLFAVGLRLGMESLHLNMITNLAQMHAAPWIEINKNDIAGLEAIPDELKPVFDKSTQDVIDLLPMGTLTKTGAMDVKTQVWGSS